MADYQVNSLENTNAPLLIGKLTGIIDDCYQECSTTSLNIDKFIHCTLTQLNKSSSLHKFIISVTTIDAVPEFSSDLMIKNTIGGSWDSNKDGLFNYKIPSKNICYLITVIWIAK